MLHRSVSQSVNANFNASQYIQEYSHNCAALNLNSTDIGSAVIQEETEMA